MFVLEYKVKPASTQIQAIEEAIRTTQFVRNKVLRFWMDNRGVGKTEMFRHNTFLRAEYSFVKELNSHACQTAVERVLRAVNRFFDNCQKNIPGKKGYPRFKHNTRSVEYKTSGWKLEECRKRITFTDKKKIGTLKLIGSRDIYFYQPEQIKRVRILRRADGYYVQFSIKLDPRDTVKPIAPSQKAIGIDVGLKYFYADSRGEMVSNPRFYRWSEKQLNRANRQKSKKFRQGKKQSNNYHSCRQRYALKHLKVSRQREEFAKKVALRLIQSNDLIVCEDLNIKGLVKNRRLSKSISDVAWSKFRRWLEYFGGKYSKLVIAVPPHYTSVKCSNCGNQVRKTLSTRTHVCSCGYVADRDTNAAINILQLGLSRVGRTLTNAWGELSSSSVGEILLDYDGSLNQESPSYKDGGASNKNVYTVLQYQNMKIVTVTGYKGGVAKSTTAIHVATFFSELGKTILIDGDPNRTSLSWAERGSFPFSVVSEKQAMKSIGGNDYVVIDTPARPDTNDLQELATGCDLLILPTTPDVVSLEPMLQTAEDLGETATFRFLITIVPPYPSKEGEVMKQELKQSNVPIFETLIRRTAGYQKAALAGVPIRDLKNADMRKAWRDYKELGKEILEILK